MGENGEEKRTVGYCSRSEQIMKDFPFLHDGVTLRMDCLMSWPSLSDIRPMLSETLFIPSARLSGRAFTALDMFLMELLKGFTNVSI